MAATPAWLASLEALLNRQIAASAVARSMASQLESRSMSIGVAGLVRIRIIIRATRAIVHLDPDTPADVDVSGPPLALARLAIAPADRAIEESNVLVKGDAEIARAFRELLQAAKPDLEEELSRQVGDITAHRLARTAEAARDWFKQLARTSAANLREYLQEESRVLVNDTEFTEFLDGVDRVREAADRIEARLRLLEQRLDGAP
jgi:ubiquinone biosynthesis accessory factor UbiJ